MAEAAAQGRAADGLTDVERLVARDEIRQLASRYADALDRRDVDTLVDLFVPDVRVGRDRIGHDALREFWIASLAPLGVTILFVGNHVIDVEDATHASGVVYCLAQVEEAGRWIEQAIRYRDTYERRGGRWLFVRRIHELWYGVDAGANPLDQPAAEWPKRSTGRGSFPYSDPTWQASGAGDSPA